MILTLLENITNILSLTFTTIKDILNSIKIQIDIWSEKFLYLLGYILAIFGFVISYPDRAYDSEDLWS